jgi:hypothetical protein
MPFDRRIAFIPASGYYRSCQGVSVFIDQDTAKKELYCPEALGKKGANVLAWIYVLL